MAGNNLEAKRQEVLKRQRDAAKKISRHRGQGVELAGTKLDPRRDPEKVKRYTAKQLDAQLQKLDSFMSRGTQYRPDAHGKPLHINDLRTYKRYERAYKQKSEKQFAPIKDKLIPGTRETFGSRMARSVPDHNKVVATNTPYKSPNRNSTNFSSEKALKKLTREMKKKLTTDYDDKVVKRDRDTFSKMMVKLNDVQLAKDVKSLTPKQFALLWNYTNFATVVSLPYHIAQSLLSGKEKPWHHDTLLQGLRDAAERVREIKQIDLGE